MLDSLVPWVTQGGAVGLLGAVAWMLFTGRLIPRRIHEQAVDTERRRGDDWHDAFQAADARADLLDKQMGEVLTFVRTAREAA